MSRRVRVYAGPSCPQDPSHGPLLEVAGLDELFCPHQSHAVPGGRAWFTHREVLAAEASAAPEAAALGRRLPVSDAAPAAAASAPGRALSPPAGGRGAEPPDELTLRAWFGDK